MKNFLKIVPTVRHWVSFAHGDACFAVGSSLPEFANPFSGRTQAEDRSNNLGPDNTEKVGVFCATDSRD